jgi:hypothetical protein
VHFLADYLSHLPSSISNTSARRATFFCARTRLAGIGVAIP